MVWLIRLARSFMVCMPGVLMGAGAFAAPVEMSIPGAPFVQHRFFHQLLKRSLEAQGHQVNLNSIEGLPQNRAYAMLESGEVSVFWGLKTLERDQKFLRVSNRLTNGLYSTRVAFVRKGQEALFQSVKSLEDLRKSGLVAGFGQIWFDAEVWRANDLAVHAQPGDWQVLFRMLASGKRGVDYFPRSVVEILDEAATHPELAIDPHLLMVYDHDMFFYVSKKSAALKSLIEDALGKADSSGLKASLIKEHFGGIHAQLNTDKRSKVVLKTPSQAQQIKGIRKE
ncbi:MAG: hypothetical protein JNK75_12130 [Betaproteobacteria bacterium]|nr:hypothetical protein [Betaproteobacteria bacterium]